MKSLTLSLGIIQNIYFGREGKAVIEAKDEFGGETYLGVHCLDIQKIVGPLLYCAAVNSNASFSEPQPDTAIPDGPLPVLEWKIGQPTVDGEPLLILTLAGGAALAFSFPPAVAQQCEQALEQAATITESAASTKSSKQQSTRR
jgi:hypothetical protein